jgi:hypothetical protein
VQRAAADETRSAAYWASLATIGAYAVDKLLWPAHPPPHARPSRTNWTRLVPPSVLTGHVSAHPTPHARPRPAPRPLPARRPSPSRPRRARRGVTGCARDWGHAGAVCRREVSPHGARPAIPAPPRPPPLPLVQPHPDPCAAPIPRCPLPSSSRSAHSRLSCSVPRCSSAAAPRSSASRASGAAPPQAPRPRAASPRLPRPRRPRAARRRPRASRSRRPGKRCSRRGARSCSRPRPKCASWPSPGASFSGPPPRAAQAASARCCETRRLHRPMLRLVSPQCISSITLRARSPQKTKPADDKIFKQLNKEQLADLFLTMVLPSTRSTPFSRAMNACPVRETRGSRPVGRRAAAGGCRGDNRGAGQARARGGRGARGAGRAPRAQAQQARGGRGRAGARGGGARQEGAGGGGEGGG